MSNRVLKFRITYQHAETGRITERYIEIGETIPALGDRWDVIGKDQFIGLTDRLGKEIYEGDIVLTPLRWVDEEYRQGQRTGKKKRVVENMGLSLFYAGDRSLQADEAKVVGTIYEQPELLKAD